MAPADHHEHAGPSDDALRSLIDEERHRERVAERQRRYWLERQAAEATELVDLLDELACRGAPVSVSTVDRRSPPAILQEVGSDYVAIAEGPGATRLIPIDAIASVHAPEHPPVAGWPRRRHATSLAERLQDAAVERPARSVSCATRAGTVSGTLRSVGRDVVVLTDPTVGAVYVQLAALVEVVLR